jgi:RNA polymerase sigma-70 factor (ECF subfamily)
VEEEPGLENRPRRVSEERAAPPDEVRVALDALSDADLVRLEKYARYRIRGLGRKARGRDHEDLLGEAVQDTLEPGKRKWNKRVSFARHLIGAMRSISSHWGQQSDGSEPLLESEILRTTEEGEVLSPFDTVRCGAPGAERILVAKEEVERIEKAVADDKVVADILRGMRAEMSPSTIRENLGLSVTEYDTAMKRLRRRVRSTAGQEGYDA